MTSLKEKIERVKIEFYPQPTSQERRGLTGDEAEIAEKIDLLSSWSRLDFLGLEALRQKDWITAQAFFSKRDDIAAKHHLYEACRLPTLEGEVIKGNTIIPMAPGFSSETGFSL